MGPISPFFINKNRTLRKVVIFLSGSGSNAEKILDYWGQEGSKISYQITLFTDRPLRSRAREIADNYGLPLIENDIKRFYQKRGCARVTLSTPLGKNIRDEWTLSIRNQLKPDTIDFGLFAGFIPLTNITSDFPCLNVHPGDLTYLKGNRRYLVGLHTIPIETAILEGLTYLRSSIIVAQPYTDCQRDMDTGPVLGISEKINIDFLGYNFETLKKISASRPSERPQGGFQDPLQEVAKFNQKKLKQEGDWVIFPRVADEFSKGHFSLGSKGGLCYKNGPNWMQIKTIIFGKDTKQVITKTQPIG